MKLRLRYNETYSLIRRDAITHVNIMNRMNGSDRGRNIAVPAARHYCAWPRVSGPSVGEPPAWLYKNMNSSDSSELCLTGSHPATCISGEVERWA